MMKFMYVKGDGLISHLYAHTCRNIFGNLPRHLRQISEVAGHIYESTFLLVINLIYQNKNDDLC
jgi:hypothetical protein